MKRKGIIGGTGIYDLGSAQKQRGEIELKVVETPYGAVEVEILKQEGLPEVVFLARHGKDHGVPPHKVNYRANLKALEMLEVDEILATCMVGSMRSQFGVGEVVTIKDFIDFTKGRHMSFFDEGPAVKHVEMSDPYCQRLRSAFYRGADAKGIRVKGGAVYVCTEGPRFETVSEIKFYQMIGGDVVGMTSVPECVLAKELGICYAAVGIVSNWAAGIGESVQFKAMGASLEQRRREVIDIFLEVFRSHGEMERSGQVVRDCKCADAVMTL